MSIEHEDELDDLMHLLYLDLTTSMQYIRLYFTTDPVLAAESTVHLTTAPKEELVTQSTTTLTADQLSAKMLETVNARCNVCFEDICKNDNQTFLLINACQHVFHKDCVMPWLVQHLTCPLCRQ